ncbi:MAG TPA: LapA family protein [Caldisericia bacterium]|jgi:uncharacterized integral membrane protein|nr:LapA family protein [Caldisericia bacterium]HXK52220.1 LapA family protein [Caldisericia bacterium]
MANVKLIIGILLSAIIVLFIVQNVTVVEIHFITWTFEMSQVLMMFILFITGIITGWIMHEFHVCKPYQKKVKIKMESQKTQEEKEETD